MTPPPTLEDPEVQDKLFKMGYGHMYCSSSACVALRTRNPHQKEVASGTLLLTPRGRPVLLTCGHLFGNGWDTKEMVMGWQAVDGSSPIGVPNRAIHPLFEKSKDVDVDVAVVVPPRGLVERLLPLARPHWQIAEDSKLEAGDITTLIGYPSEYSDVRPNQQGFSTFSATALPPRQPYPSREGTIDFGWCETSYGIYSLSGPNGTPRKLPSAPPGFPGGMSGGAMWRMRPRRLSDDEVWLADDHARIIGVQRSYVKETNAVRIVPVEQWRGWVLATMVEIDASGV